MSDKLSLILINNISSIDDTAISKDIHPVESKTEIKILLREKLKLNK